MSKRQKAKKRPKRRYDTPGRICAHGDSGCCPRCMNPFAVVRFRSRKLIDKEENDG